MQMLLCPVCSLSYKARTMAFNSTISLRGWVYEIDQNFETGELKVLSVRKGEISKPTMIQKTAQYLKAEASGLVGSVSLEVLVQRKDACSACESCDKQAEGTWYCNSCGCPKWERSRMQVKWEMPAATCPLGKWPQVG